MVSHASYGRQVGAVQEYLVHFTPVEVSRERMKFLAGESHVPVIHVHHDQEARRYTIIRSANPADDLEVVTKDGVQ